MGSSVGPNLVYSSLLRVSVPKLLIITIDLDLASGVS